MNTTQNTHKGRVLVSAAASPAAVSLILHMKSKGYFVIGMDANPEARPLGESVCDAFYEAPLAKGMAYIEFLLSIYDDFDIFLPYIDEEIYEICNNIDKFPSLNKIMLSDIDTLNICLSKKRFQTYCEQRLLPVAPLAETPPAIYKPEYGRGGKGVVDIDEEVFFKIYQSMPTGIVQKKLAGQEYTVDCLIDQSGILIQAVARKRILSSGVSVIGEIDQNPQVLELVDKVVRSFSFNGLINIQIMLTESGPYLIEINPRVSGSLIFTILAGADMISAVLDMYLHGVDPTDFPVTNKRIIRYWSEYEVGG